MPQARPQRARPLSSRPARGRWRERLDLLLDMLVVLGKARVEAGDVPRYRRGG
jgi:hypothetical protein